MEGTPKKYINFGCGDATQFILELYKFLNDKHMCFLSGAFVFDNDDDSLYNTLIYGNTETKCDQVNIRSISKTHKQFQDHEKFKQQKTLSGPGPNPKENVDLSISESSQIEKPANYTYDQFLYGLCNDECNIRNFNNCKQNDEDCIKEEKEYCDDLSRRLRRGVILFHRFLITLKNEDNDFTTIRTANYLFLKLEEYPLSSSASSFASHALKFAKGTKETIFANRREDKGDFNKKRINWDLQQVISYLREKNKDDAFIQYVIKKIEFFNKYVRSLNEMYIPNELLFEILSENLIKPTKAKEGRLVEPSSKSRPKGPQSAPVGGRRSFVNADDHRTASLPISSSFQSEQLPNVSLQSRQSSGHDEMSAMRRRFKRLQSPLRQEQLEISISRPEGAQTAPGRQRSSVNADKAQEQLEISV